MRKPAFVSLILLVCILQSPLIADPLDTVTATASPNPVSMNGFISLTGSMTGDTTPYSAAWYLGSSTSGEQLIASGWTTQYQAPDFSTTLNFKFKVKEISGIKETVKTVPVIVSSSGGGGGGTPPPPPPDPICGCSQPGDPPEVRAHADSTTVLGGQTLGLSGEALDPNWPIGTAGSAPSLLWTIAETGGLTGLSLIGADQANAQLTTPAEIDSDQWILLKLEARNVSNQCACWDHVQVQVLSGASGQSAGILYSFDGQSFMAAPDAGVVSEKFLSFPVEIGLKANQFGFDNPGYSWATSHPGATLSLSNASTTTLTVTGEKGQTIAAPVSLTVFEKADTSSSVSSNVSFVVEVPLKPPASADFTVSPAGQLEAGTLATLQASVEAVNSQGAEYEWAIDTDHGESVPVMTNGGQAAFEVPVNADELFIQLTVTLPVGTLAPVVKRVEVTPPALRFAHFGVGPTGEFELVVELILANASTEEVEDIAVTFTDQEGVPTEVRIDDTTVPLMGLSLEGTSGRRIRISSPNDELRVGWIQVTSPAKIGGLIEYKYLEGTKARKEISLFPSIAAPYQMTVLGPGTNGDIGLAVANPSSVTVEFEIEIVGQPYGVEKTFVLGPKEQMAKFITELFNPLSLPEDFTGGTLSIRVTEGTNASLIATVLKLTEDSLTTAPLVAGE